MAFIVDDGDNFTLGTFGDDIIYGLGGNDTIYGGPEINGFPEWGDDKIYGGSGNDTLYGRGGNDTLDGGSGRDLMVGGFGDDVYHVDSWGFLTPSDRVVEYTNEGTDLVYSSVSYFLPTNVENLTLTGSAATYGFGNTLDNVMKGNNNDNRLLGSGGDDTLYGRSGNDTLDGGPGKDTAYGGNGDDKIDGGKGNDRLYGSSGKDLLFGDAGNDRLSGGFSSDTLTGGDGFDTLTGGSENDVFDFNSTSESPFAVSFVGRQLIYLRDLITDFQYGDDIDVSTIDANVLARGNQAFSFLGTNAFSAAGQIRVYNDYFSSNTIVQLNTDADFAAEAEIAIQDGARTASWYDSGDFIL